MNWKRWRSETAAQRIGFNCAAQAGSPMKRSLRNRIRRMQVRVRQRVPAGVRLLLGIVLICLGIVGFLPVVGFWMIPLGIAVAALDVVPLWRWVKARR